MEVIHNTFEAVFERFENEFGLKPNEYYVTQYGSRVYQTNEPYSDYDFIIIINKDDVIYDDIELLDGQANIHVYDKRTFQSKLSEHKIFALETYFLNRELQDILTFTLQLDKLRKEISSVSSNSFVKADKKIRVENDFYIGWKSLFHSIRIIMFGIQIAETGEIYDFSQANHYWLDIMREKHYDWQPLKLKYKPIKNRLLTEFRKLAPKENYNKQEK